MDNIENLELEVRKAYRFLFQYQNHILHMIRFIGTSYGLVYYGGKPMFSDAAPKNWKGSLDNWAWDWLNMYFYQFSFNKENDKEKFFSVFLLNDTGFYQKRDENKDEGRNERLDLKNFEDIDKSQTKLILVASENKWETFENWQSKRFLLEDTEDNRIPYKSGNTVTVYKSFRLSDFYSEENAIKSLDLFSDICAKNGVDIKRRKRVDK